MFLPFTYYIHDFRVIAKVELVLIIWYYRWHLAIVAQVVVIVYFTSFDI